MNNTSWKKYWKLHWIKIIVGLIGLVLFAILIYLIVVGMKSFIELESFYKKMTLASIPLQLFLGIITAFIFAGIYTFFSFYFFYGGGMRALIPSCLFFLSRKNPFSLFRFRIDYCFGKEIGFCRLNLLRENLTQ